MCLIGVRCRVRDVGCIGDGRDQLGEWDYGGLRMGYGVYIYVICMYEAYVV